MLKHMCAVMVLAGVAAGPVWAAAVTLGPSQTVMVFRVNHDLGYTVGQFKDVAVDLDMSDDRADVRTVKATVATASIDTWNAVRDQGLRSAMFLDAAKFPQAVFESTKIEGDQVIGNLTIKGVTQPFTFKIEKASDGKVIRLVGAFDRSAFGITYNQTLPNKKKTIGETVDITMELHVATQ